MKSIILTLFASLMTVAAASYSETFTNTVTASGTNLVCSFEQPKLPLDQQPVYNVRLLKKETYGGTLTFYIPSGTGIYKDKLLASDDFVIKPTFGDSTNATVRIVRLKDRRLAAIPVRKN